MKKSNTTKGSASGTVEAPAKNQKLGSRIYRVFETTTCQTCGVTEELKKSRSNATYCRRCQARSYEATMTS